MSKFKVISGSLLLLVMIVSFQNCSGITTGVSAESVLANSKVGMNLDDNTGAEIITDREPGSTIPNINSPPTPPVTVPPSSGGGSAGNNPQPGGSSGSQNLPSDGPIPAATSEEVLARNDACKSIDTLLTPASAPVNAKDYQIKFKTGSVSIPEANRLSVSLSNIKLEALNVASMEKVNLSHGNFCIGYHELDTSKFSLISGDILSLVNRSGSIKTLKNFKLSAFREVHLVKTNVDSFKLIAVQNLVVDGGNVGEIKLAAIKNVLLLNGSGVDKYSHSAGTLDVRDGTVREVSQSAGKIIVRSGGTIESVKLFRGTIEMYGGTIEDISQSSAKIILHNGAKILKNDNSNLEIIEMK